MRDGFREAEFSDRTGLTLDRLEPGLSQCLEDALLEQGEGFIRCTDKGWNFLDNVLEKFI